MIKIIGANVSQAWTLPLRRVSRTVFHVEVMKSLYVATFQMKKTTKYTARMYGSSCLKNFPVDSAAIEGDVVGIVMLLAMMNTAMCWKAEAGTFEESGDEVQADNANTIMARRGVLSDFSRLGLVNAKDGCLIVVSFGNVRFGQWHGLRKNWRICSGCLLLRRVRGTSSVS